MKKSIDNKKLSKQLLKIAEDEALRQSLLFKTEGLIKDKGSDSSLDILHEKIQLISGVEISISGIRKIISNSLRNYKPKFRLEYYEEIFRLNGWNIEDAKKYYKPKEVALYTNEIIYGRFPKEVLPVIQWKNPFINFTQRANKNFQWLTEDGEIKLLNFIDDSVRVMKTSSEWHEFKVKYANEFGLPFQMSLFDSNK